MFKSKYLVLAVALFLIWVGAFFVFHIAAFLLRALLIIAALLFIAHLVSSRKRA